MLLKRKGKKKYIQSLYVSIFSRNHNNTNLHSNIFLSFFFLPTKFHSKYPNKYHKYTIYKNYPSLSINKRNLSIKPSDLERTLHPS